MFLNRRFLISDKGSKNASIMDLSDLSLNYFDEPSYQNYSQNKQNLSLSQATPAVLNHCP